MRRTVGAGAVVALVSFTMAACGDDASGPDDAGDGTTTTAPMQVSDEQLVSEFLDLLEAGDIEGLDAFLSPAFQIQRSDGSFLDKTEYLANPADVEEYEISEVVGTRVGDVRVVRWTLVASTTIDGRQLSPDPAPRLSTFVWSGERWQLVAHANFAQIEG